MLSEIMAIVRETGKLIRNADISKAAFRQKTSKRDLCSACDIEVQAQLFDRLAKLLPEAQFIGEEQSARPTVGGGWCFIIDPIDGTANFAHDYRHSCISVALVKDDTPVIGVVYNPYMDELFYAEKGSGAYLNGLPIHVSGLPLFDSIIAFGTSPYDLEYKRDTFALAEKVFDKSLDIRRTGSAALDLCYTACGRVDGFFELILRPWDFAAGSVILTEAGGVITTLDGDPIVQKKDSSVCAATPAAHAELLELYKIYKEG